MEKILEDYLKNLDNIENPLTVECIKSIKEEKVIFRYKSKNTSLNLVEFYKEKKNIQEQLQNFNLVNDYKNLILSLKKIDNEKLIQIVRVFTEKKLFTIFHLMKTGKIISILTNNNFNIKKEDEINDINNKKGYTSDFLKFEKGELLEYKGITSSILNWVD